MENFILMKQSDFTELVHKLNVLISALEKNPTHVADKTWVTQAEACKLLNVSGRTLQNYRDEGRIGFSKTGRKVYYKREELENLLNSRYNSGF
jgi:excisionase family DNA binding protein